MRKLYYDFKFKLRYIMRGIKTRKEFHIGDIVAYKGIAYFISNAVKRDHNGVRIYKLVENVPFDESGKRKSIEVNEKEIYKVKCWSNFKRGIMSVYNFNMTYWHEINLRKVLE